MPLVSQRYLTRLSQASLRLSTLKVLPLRPAVILSSFLSYKDLKKMSPLLKTILQICCLEMNIFILIIKPALFEWALTVFTIFGFLFVKKIIQNKVSACKNPFSNTLRGACFSFLLAVCDSKSCSESHSWMYTLKIRPMIAKESRNRILTRLSEQI